jgi:radical SAM protein with 4Fe4S-binding SPASM domain
LKFLRTYIEISNICNLQCTFCPEVEREKKVLTKEEFKSTLVQVLPHTEQVCLHLMGEPLTHPEFKDILQICDEEKASIHLVTNGTLLSKYSFDVFFKTKSLRQINFSLHSFKDNFPGQDVRPYLYDILEFSKQALKERPDLYVNFRFWNLEDLKKSNEENKELIDHICEFFQVPAGEREDISFRKSKNITGRIYFHFDTRFEWPNLGDPDRGDKGFCHALSQQIGIHADGTIVPCCLDKEAKVPLGNIRETSFENIINSSRLKNMREGFQKHILTEELCRKCTFIKRFDNKARPHAAPILK